MTNFQITIVPPHEIAKGIGSQAQKERFGVRQHTRGAQKLIERIEDLGGVWDQVIEKLTALASKSQTTAAATQYELSSIEFNIGIEAGLSIGLVTKGEASVSIVFAKKGTGGK